METDGSSLKRMRDICDIISSRRVHASDYVTEGVPFYRGKEIIEKANFQEVAAELFITPEKFSELSRKNGAPEAGDILLTSVGTLGVPYVVKAGEKFYFKDGNLTWFRNLRGVDSRYLRYWLLSPVGRAELKKCQIGSSQPAYTIVLLKGMEIDLPSLPTQRKIAAILSAYDDLIENNTRRVQVLEQMARALYREWFVEYRFPGHEQAEWVEDEAGRRPKGWEVLPFEEVLAFAIGGGWGKEEPEEKFPESGYVIRGTDIPDVRHGGIGAAPLRFHASSNIRSRRLKAGDIVFEVSGGSKGQPVGRSALMTEILLSNFDDDVICASFCKLLRIRTDYPPILIFHMLNEWYNNGKIEEYQTQSTGIINFKFEPFLKGAMVVLPPQHLRERFAEIAGVWLEAIHSIGQRNANLRRTRDLLLPRLVSGELDVSGLRVAGAEGEMESDIHEGEG